MLDYIFGNFYYYNRKSGENNAVLMAYHSLSFFISFNILSASFYYCYFLKVPIYSKVVGLVFLMVYSVTYFFFIHKKRHIMVYNRYIQNKTKYRDRLVVAYVILSIILMIIIVALRRAEMMPGL